MIVRSLKYSIEVQMESGEATDLAEQLAGYEPLGQMAKQMAVELARAVQKNLEYWAQEDNNDK